MNVSGLDGFRLYTNYIEFIFEQKYQQWHFLLPACYISNFLYGQTDEQIRH